MNYTNTCISFSFFLSEFEAIELRNDVLMLIIDLSGHAHTGPVLFGVGWGEGVGMSSLARSLSPGFAGISSSSSSVY